MTFRKYSARFAAMAFSLALALAVTPGQVRAQPKPDDVVAVVNGTEITELSLALAAAIFGNQLQQIPEAQRRAALIGVVIDMNLLADAAEAEQLDTTDEFKARFQFLRTRALHDEYLAKKIAASVSDADVQDKYDSEVKNIESPEETRARHILVATQAEADALIAELEKGADFVELAKSKSTGPSGPGGGDLGYFTKDRMVKPFADAAFSMEPGTHSKTPVESQFGWHVIKVEDRRTKPKPSFAEMSEQIRNSLVRAKFVEAIAELKAKAAIEIKQK